MALTTEDVKDLCERFKPGQHGFQNFGGHKPYIEEFAITSRLDKVDPSWSMKHVASYNRDSQTVCVLELTIKDVTRVGVGMQDILLDKKGENEVNEPEKAAATDALKRAARLFGVGRYLLVAPDSVQNQASLQAWFDSIDASRQKQAIESGEAVEGNGQKNPAPAETKSAPAQPEAPATPKGNSGPQEATPPKWWKAVTTDKELVALAGSQELLAVMVKDALKEGKMKPEDSVQMAKDFARELATAEIPF